MSEKWTDAENKNYPEFLPDSDIMANLELSTLRAELATKLIHTQLAQKAIDTYISEAISRGLKIEKSSR